MNKQAVVIGAFAGLLVQIAVGMAMGVLWVDGNMRGIMALLIVAALASAFMAGLVAAIMSKRKQLTHGIIAALLLLLASTLNNIFTGNFELRGFFIGATIAPALGYLGARGGRRITLSKSDQSTKKGLPAELLNPR